MELILWGAVLLAAVWAANWGSNHVAEPLRKLRKQWGFSAAAGGSIIGMATASPEVGVNITSAVRGVSEIGLGVMLGSTAIGIPALVTVSYLATRTQQIPGDPDHEQHRRKHLVRVDPSAATVQALPYLAILALVALLTMPEGWRGLQPLDGWILVAAYVCYVAQALLRGRTQAESTDWSKREIWLALTGVGVLALGAYFTVISTENIIKGLGISRIVGGLFITAPVAVLPEAFAAWNVARSGQMTPALTNAIGDHAMTMTVAFLPLALVGVPIDHFRVYWVSFAFVALMPLLYAAFIALPSGEPGFRRGHVAAFVGSYLVYLTITAVWVLNLF